MKWNLHAVFSAAVFFAIILFPAFAGAGETIRATTETGKEVLLSPDGTWSYKDADRKSVPAPASSIKLIKGKREKYGISYDENRWKLSADKQTNEDAEYEFRHTSGDAYAMLIFDRVQVPTESLKKIALENARAVARDAQITLEEKRSVNGRDVIALRIDGTIEGIPFTYFGYYYSGKGGSIQFITYTARELFDEYRQDCTRLLDGLEVYE